MHDDVMNRTHRMLAVESIKRKILARTNLWIMPQDEFDACMRAVGILERRAENILFCRDIKHT